MTDWIKLKELFDQQAEKPLSKGWNWYELSDEESLVFDIDPDRWPAMLTAYHCFEAVTGQSDNEWLELAPDIKDPSRSFNRVEFSKFAKEFDITYREAFAVWTKVEWWQVRNDIMSFADEPDFIGFSLEPAAERPMPTASDLVDMLRRLITDARVLSYSVDSTSDLYTSQVNDLEHAIWLAEQLIGQEPASPAPQAGPKPT